MGSKPLTTIPRYPCKGLREFYKSKYNFIFTYKYHVTLGLFDVLICVRIPVFMGFSAVSLL